MKKLFGAILVALSFLSCTAMADLAVPPEGRRIIDLAGVLNSAQTVQLYGKIDDLQKATGAQVDILVVPALGGEPIAQYAAKVDSVWYPEENAVDKHILFVVSSSDKSAQLVVGDGLKDILSESDLGSIISSNVITALKQGQPAMAISQGVDALSTKVEEARVEDITPPLRTALTKPMSVEDIVHYLLIIAGSLGFLGALVYLGKRRDFAEYLKSRRKRFR